MPVRLVTWKVKLFLDIIAYIIENYRKYQIIKRGCRETRHPLDILLFYSPICRGAFLDSPPVILIGGPLFESQLGYMPFNADRSTL